VPLPVACLQLVCNTALCEAQQCMCISRRAGTSSRHKCDPLAGGPSPPCSKTLTHHQCKEIPSAMLGTPTSDFSHPPDGTSTFMQLNIQVCCHGLDGLEAQQTREWSITQNCVPHKTCGTCRTSGGTGPCIAMLQKPCV
jgi:hypothetical protein